VRNSIWEGKLESPFAGLKLCKPLVPKSDDLPQLKFASPTNRAFHLSFKQSFQPPGI
jgi:hypothetical protein